MSNIQVFSGSSLTSSSWLLPVLQLLNSGSFSRTPWRSCRAALGAKYLPLSAAGIRRRLHLSGGLLPTTEQSFLPTAYRGGGHPTEVVHDIPCQYHIVQKHLRLLIAYSAFFRSCSTPCLPEISCQGADIPDPQPVSQPLLSSSLRRADR